MDAKRILKYLRQLAKNNNRTWFQEHRQEYDAVRADFEQGVEQAIRRIVPMFRAAKPMMDMMNAVIDDYE